MPDAGAGAAVDQKEAQGVFWDDGNVPCLSVVMVSRVCEPQTPPSEPLDRPST